MLSFTQVRVHRIRKQNPTADEKSFSDFPSLVWIIFCLVLLVDIFLFIRKRILRLEGCSLFAEISQQGFQNQEINKPKWRLPLYTMRFPVTLFRLRRVWKLLDPANDNEFSPFFSERKQNRRRKKIATSESSLQLSKKKKET